jgi:hypothetical protein
MKTLKLCKFSLTACVFSVLLSPAFAAPAVPSSPDSIMGQGKLDAAQLGAYLIMANRDVEDRTALDLAKIYIKEAAAEGVNSDVAFSQMCYATNFLKFGGLLDKGTNNYGGIGVGKKDSGPSFASVEEGVRAHIQHLKAYASEEDLRQPQADPRYWNVRFGCAPRVSDLSGKWSSDPDYGAKIKSQLDGMYFLAYAELPRMQKTMASWDRF